MIYHNDIIYVLNHLLQITLLTINDIWIFWSISSFKFIRTPTLKMMRMLRKIFEDLIITLTLTVIKFCFISLQDPFLMPTLNANPRRGDSFFFKKIHFLFYKPVRSFALCALNSFLNNTFVNVMN